MFLRLLVIAFCLVCIWGVLAKTSSASGHSRSYVVKSGDTLWSIAGHYYSGDGREGVWELERRNNLGDSETLVPGQRLLLPW